MSVYREVDHFLDRVKIRIVKVSEKPQDSWPENLFLVDKCDFFVCDFLRDEM